MHNCERHCKYSHSSLGFPSIIVALHRLLDIVLLHTSSYMMNWGRSPTMHVHTYQIPSVLGFSVLHVANPGLSATWLDMTTCGSELASFMIHGSRPRKLRALRNMKNKDKDNNNSKLV